MDINRFFVYGTLKRNQCRQHCWPHAPIRVDNATVAGTLYDLGPYPALDFGNDRILGEVWSFQTIHMQETLKVIEDYARTPADLYRREVVEATLTNGQNVWAYAYYYRITSELTQAITIRPNPSGICVWE